ncbi:hypothetical protein B0H14DRAFT_3518744 [Mycena olivaceomarginata]|nr:hypothetical protein B0H14DRAFT_3518744 [Mycena olivaceomarginata]
MGWSQHASNFSEKPLNGTMRRRIHGQHAEFEDRNGCWWWSKKSFPTAYASTSDASNIDTGEMQHLCGKEGSLKLEGEAEDVNEEYKDRLGGCTIKYNEWNESVVTSTHDSHPLLLPVLCATRKSSAANIIRPSPLLRRIIENRTCKAKAHEHRPCSPLPGLSSSREMRCDPPAAIDTHKEEERGSAARIDELHSRGVRLEEWEGEADDERSEAKGSTHAAVEVRPRGAHTSSEEAGRRRDEQSRCAQDEPCASYPSPAVAATSHINRTRDLQPTPSSARAAAPHRIYPSLCFLLRPTEASGIKTWS